MKRLAPCSNPVRGNGFAGRGRMGLDNGHVPGMWAINYLDCLPRAGHGLSAFPGHRLYRINLLHTGRVCLSCQLLPI